MSWSLRDIGWNTVDKPTVNIDAEMNNVNGIRNDFWAGEILVAVTIKYTLDSCMVDNQHITTNWFISFHCFACVVVAICFENIFESGLDFRNDAIEHLMTLLWPYIQMHVNPLWNVGCCEITRNVIIFEVQWKPKTFPSLERKLIEFHITETGNQTKSISSSSDGNFSDAFYDQIKTQSVSTRNHRVCGHTNTLTSEYPMNDGHHYCLCFDWVLNITRKRFRRVKR